MGISVDPDTSGYFSTTQTDALVPPLSFETKVTVESVTVSYSIQSKDTTIPSPTVSMVLQS